MKTGRPHALISVADKTDAVPFARSLAERGYRLLATGGTHRLLTEADVESTPVSEITGVPELLEGRVKTLHPAIHAGILARPDREGDLAELRTHGYPLIEVVAVTLAGPSSADSESAAEDRAAPDAVDIGGSALLRAAAKNHTSTWVASAPSEYTELLEGLRASDDRAAQRRRLAQRAFARTSRYDAEVAGALSRDDGTDALPAATTLELRRSESLRYGENPNRSGALYATSDRDGPLLDQLHGRELSYNNVADLDAAIRLTGEFDRPAAVVVKHGNPAGCAVGDTVEAAFERALACDPMSAYGGIVHVTRPVDRETARKLHDHFLEVVAAPAFEDPALELLRQKERLRLVTLPENPEPPELELDSTVAGVLVQSAAAPVAWARESVDVPTERTPTEGEWRALSFNWCVCKHVKSNAIVLGGEDRTLGIGAGQMSRVDAVELAVRKSRDSLDGAVMASDGFLPFRDGLDAAAEAGIRAVVQPGGSKNDDEVIDACDEHGVAMVTTGRRHFRH